MVLRINWRFAIVAGPKSRVPFGRVGFSIVLVSGLRFDVELKTPLLA
jgi:hypothetical protein